MNAPDARTRLIRISNAWYNQGLEMARVRNLSGAAVSLQTSLRFNKYHTDARNLLGLVYFATGELVSAVSEWVISQDLQPENNRASEYLARLQKHDAWLDRMNGCIRKYNTALKQIGEGEEDAAILQLTSCISTFRTFLRAHQLLGLLYLKHGKPAKAMKVLKKALTIDPSNPVTQGYLKDLRESDEFRKQARLLRRESRKEAEQEVEESAAEAYRNDVIIPTYRSTGMIGKMALVLLAGLILGGMIVWYGIMPEQIRDVKQEQADIVVSYNSKLATKDADREALASRITSLEKDVEQLQAELATYTGDDGVITNYNTLLEAVAVYLEGDTLGAMDEFVKVNGEAVSYEGYQKTYRDLEQVLGISDYGRLYEAGVSAYVNGNREQSIAYLERALAIAPDSVQAMYYLAHAYEKVDRPADAWVVYDRIQREFPGFAQMGEVEARLAVLKDYAPSEETPTQPAQETQPEAETAAP